MPKGRSNSLPRGRSLKAFIPKKRLGQHFLFDKNILNKIVSALELNKNDTVLEIGAGLGSLTSLLVEYVKKLIALEIDREATVLLCDKFSQERNIEIINQNFLKYTISRKFIKQKIKVVGNIPFYITSAIIEHLFNFRDRINYIFITVQKEVAERIVALPSSSNYSAFSCFVQYYTKPKVLFNIKRSCFWPKPEVDSAFLRLEILKNPLFKVKDERLFFKIVRCAFGQRRKTFVNALTPISRKEDTLLAIKDLSLEPNIRVENLSLKELSLICNRLQMKL